MDVQQEEEHIHFLRGKIINTSEASTQSNCNGLENHRVEIQNHSH